MRTRLHLVFTAALAASALSSAALAETRVARATAVSRGPGEGAAFRAGDFFEFRLGAVPLEEAAQFPSSFTIGGDGTVNIPLIGQIRAAGLTQSQLERAIQERFVSDKIFRWPTVTINVPTTTRFVTVGGEVRAPQRMLWSADLTVMTALSAAAGPGDFAGDKVNLIRNGTVTTYSRKNLQRHPEEDPKLQPGDRLELR